MKPIPAEGTLLCPNCSNRVPLPRTALVIVTGVAGSGKSTVVQELRKIVGPPITVLDVDSLVYRRDDVENFTGDWIRIAFEVACSGGYPVLVGDLEPQLIDNLDTSELFSEKYVGLIEVPDDLLTARLRRRPQWRGWTEDRIRSEVLRAQALREQVHMVFGGAADPHETALPIADWITSLTGLTGR